ncbi:MAG: DNA recombination protein RmuC, partial [Rubrivivax sp.]|nr:DNA recombination protein RmuC [Rubrivivax sp.]
MTAWILIALAASNLLLLVWALVRRSPADTATAERLERLERSLRDELGRQGQAARNDLASFQQALLAQSGDVARTQNEQIDSFRTQLASTQTALLQQAQAARDAQEAALRRLGEGMEQRLGRLQEGNEAKLEQMRAT